jgi:hypothetical protein
MRLLMAALVSLVLVPTTGRWTTLVTAKGASLTQQREIATSALRTRAGSELVVFNAPEKGTLSLSRNGEPLQRLIKNADEGQAELVQQPNGAIQLYFENAEGVGRLTSTNDGRTWIGPVRTASRQRGGLHSAAVAPDGTPFFTQDGFESLTVFRGLNGAQSRNVFATCCVVHESIVVDSAGLVQVAFWANQPNLSRWVLQALDPSLKPIRTVQLSGQMKTTLVAPAPLVADRQGNTFAGWTGGRYVATGFYVQRLRHGRMMGTPARVWRDHVWAAALALEPDGKLWAVWTGDDELYAARSRSMGAHFGAPVRLAYPGPNTTPYTLEALARPGSVSAYVSTGTELIASSRLRPGLAVVLKGVGGHLVAAVTDDRAPVRNAVISYDGRAFHANGSARIVLAGIKRGTVLTASAPGYTDARFTAP